MFEPWKATFSGYKKHKYITEFFNKSLDKGANILDIGCGVGMLSRQLAQEGFFNIEGIDPDPDAIENAKKLSGHLKIEYRVDKFRPGITKKKYDAIWMDSVLEHIQEYEDWVEELGRITKPNGYVFIIVPSIFGAFSLMNDIDWKKLKWKPQPYNHHPLLHCNHFTYKQLKDIFSRNNLEVKKVFKFQAFNPLVKYILKKLRLYTIFYKPYTCFDYYLSKILPVDVSTRILIFQKSD